MSRVTAVMVACALMASARSNVHAQAKVIPGEHRTTSATVEAVDVAARRITLRTAKGEMRTIHVPEQATRLADIKLGDTVTATYYDNIVIRVKEPGEPDVDTKEAAITPGSGSKPGGTSATQETITATIETIDLNEPSIGFKGPRDWKYRTKVKDKNALQQVKVGDRVDIIWTEATLVSVSPATK